MRNDFFWEYIEPYAHLWKGKAVLDVGAGTGWLVNKARECGASLVVGIEPSEKNIAQGREDHPQTELIQTTLEEYDSKGQRFEAIVAVMSFPHIADVDKAFKIFRSLLDEAGEVIIVIPDYDYSGTQRHDYSLEKQAIDEDQYAVELTRSWGVMADIIRKTNVYQSAAESSGFYLVEEKEMVPTERQIASAPKYAAFKDKAITRLLRFKMKSI